MTRVELLVADLRALSKTIGELTVESVASARTLLSLPGYMDLPFEEERRIALLGNLKEAVDDLPPEERLYARLLFSYEGSGTNITHRRKLAGMDSKPNIVAQLRERYIFALVASRLLEYAGRSTTLDRGPGYLHERISYHIKVSPESKAKHICAVHYDLRIVRDAVYLYMVANDDTSDGLFYAEPWKVPPGSEQSDVGAVPFDPAIQDGPTMTVVYLGRPYSRGETCRVSLIQEREYAVPPPEYLCDSDTPPRPIELDLTVDCPQAWAPSYDRVEFASGALTAPELKRKTVLRKNNDPMTFHISATKPTRRYAIRWKT